MSFFFSPIRPSDAKVKNLGQDLKLAAGFFHSVRTSQESVLHFRSHVPKQIRLETLRGEMNASRVTFQAPPPVINSKSSIPARLSYVACRVVPVVSEEKLNRFGCVSANLFPI